MLAEMRMRKALERFDDFNSKVWVNPDDPEIKDFIKKSRKPLLEMEEHIRAVAVDIFIATVAKKGLSNDT